MSRTFESLARVLRGLQEDARMERGFQVRLIRELGSALSQLKSWDGVDKSTILDFQEVLIDAEMDEDMLYRLEQVLCDAELRLANLIGYAQHEDGDSFGAALSEIHQVLRDRGQSMTR